MFFIYCQLLSMISNPPLGIEDGNCRIDNTLASIFPPCVQKDEMNREILHGTWPTISGINFFFLFSIQAAAYRPIFNASLFFFFFQLCKYIKYDFWENNKLYNY